MPQFYLCVNERKCENRLKCWIASTDKYPKNKLYWEKEIFFFFNKSEKRILENGE